MTKNPRIFIDTGIFCPKSYKFIKVYYNLVKVIDGVVADRYSNVCPCGEGAVADVIYEKIPEILKNENL